jgi:hypothetical protein
MKTGGDIAKRARIKAKLLLVAMLAFMPMVSLWTGFTRRVHGGTPDQ